MATPCQGLSRSPSATGTRSSENLRSPSRNASSAELPSPPLTASSAGSPMATPRPDPQQICRMHLGAHHGAIDRWPRGSKPWPIDRPIDQRPLQRLLRHPADRGRKPGGWAAVPERSAQPQRSPGLGGNRWRNNDPRSPDQLSPCGGGRAVTAAMTIPATATVANPVTNAAAVHGPVSAAPRRLLRRQRPPSP